MQKFTQLSIALDDIQIKTAHKMLDVLLEKITTYNEAVTKSNRLLREQESLRKRLNINIKHGEIQGLAGLRQPATPKQQIKPPAQK